MGHDEHYAGQVLCIQRHHAYWANSSCRPAAKARAFHRWTATKAIAPCSWWMARVTVYLPETQEAFIVNEEDTMFLPEGTGLPLDELHR